MGAGISVPTKLTESMFTPHLRDLKAASDIFRSWAEANSDIEKDLALRMASLNIQIAFAVMSRFIHTKRVDQYRAMKLYIDIAERDLMYIPADKPAIKDSFTAVVKFLTKLAGVIDEKIREAREVEELVEFKRAEVRFAAEDAKALEARLADLHARLDALKDKEAKKKTSTRGGAYRFPRRMSRSYCRRTTCRRMGFTQRASCRPYKNCYRGTRRVKST